MRNGRQLIFWVAALLVAAAAYFFWHTREVEIRGRVMLRSWDGGVSVPESAQALVYARPSLKSFLRGKLQALAEDRAAAEVRSEEARRVWREKVAAREETRKILRVAERGNAADLAQCRARHAEAEDEANRAYEELERRTALMDKLADPAAILSGVSGALSSARVDGEGRFSLKATLGQRPVLVVLVPSGESGAGAAWLQRADSFGGNAVEVELSNTNLLTLDGLQDFLGVAQAAGARQ